MMVQKAARQQQVARHGAASATHPIISWPGAQPPQGVESHILPPGRHVMHPDSLPPPPPPPPTGYGILFFHQLGIVQYLERAFDLAQCTHVGSSAGSMLSVLAACNVEPQVPLRRPMPTPLSAAAAPTRALCASVTHLPYTHRASCRPRWTSRTSCAFTTVFLSGPWAWWGYGEASCGSGCTPCYQPTQQTGEERSHTRANAATSAPCATATVRLGSTLTVLT